MTKRTTPVEIFTNPLIKKASTEAVVEGYPKCNFCPGTAGFDAKTTYGPWAYMCSDCFAQFGIKLGLGFGQKLVLR